MADNKVVVKENKLVQSKNFTMEVVEEMKKVTWPDFPQLKSATGVIIVFVLIVSLIILAMDATVRGLIGAVMGIFAK
jgi:preprotein translocase SecE subunit